MLIKDHHIITLDLYTIELIVLKEDKEQEKFSIL